MEIIYEALVMTNVQIKLKAFDILFNNPSHLFRLTAFLTILWEDITCLSHQLRYRIFQISEDIVYLFVFS